MDRLKSAVLLVFAVCGVEGRLVLKNSSKTQRILKEYPRLFGTVKIWYSFYMNYTYVEL